MCLVEVLEHHIAASIIAPIAIAMPPRPHDVGVDPSQRYGEAQTRMPSGTWRDGD